MTGRRSKTLKFEFQPGDLARFWDAEGVDRTVRIKEKLSTCLRVHSPSDNIFIYGFVNLSFPSFFSLFSLTFTPSACSQWRSTDPSLYELIFFTYILLSLAFLPYRTLLVHCFLPCPTGNGTYRLFIGVGSATIDIVGDRLYPVTQTQRIDSTPSTTDSDTSSRSIGSSTSPTSFDSTGTQSTTLHSHTFASWNPSFICFVLKLPWPVATHVLLLFFNYPRPFCECTMTSPVRNSITAYQSSCFSWGLKCTTEPVLVRQRLLSSQAVRLT